MEVDVSLPFLDGGLDVPLGAESVARHGKPHGAHARYDAASVFGMRPEVVLYHRQRRVAPTQMKKHDCHLIVPVWRVGLRLYLAQDPQGVVIVPLIRARLRDASQGVVLAGRDRDRLLELCNRLVQPADVQVDIPQRPVRPAHVRVEAQGAPVFLSRSLVEEVAGWPPQQAGLDRKSTRLNSSHVSISYAVFCLKKKTKTTCA